jgi:hypothetical protein
MSGFLDALDYGVVWLAGAALIVGWLFYLEAPTWRRYRGASARLAEQKPMCPVDRVQRLLDQYIDSEHLDPTPFLAQVDGLERRELAALIDAYLRRLPRRGA